MANWNVLKAAVANIINANGNQEITGQLLQNVLNNIITNVGENATFAGIANLNTNPGAPDGPVFYLATTAGTYPNFNGAEVQDGEAVILQWNNGVWSKKATGFATQEKMQELEENTNEKLSQLGSEVEKISLKVSYKNYSSDAFVNIGYIKPSGELAPSSGWHYTDFIPLNNAVKVYTKNLDYNNMYVAFLAFYDKDKEPIQLVSNVVGVKDSVYEVEVPNGAVFVRASSIDSKENPQIALKSKDSRISDLDETLAGLKTEVEAISDDIDDVLFASENSIGKTYAAKNVTAYTRVFNGTVLPKGALLTNKGVALSIAQSYTDGVITGQHNIPSNSDFLLTDDCTYILTMEGGDVLFFVGTGTSKDVFDIKQKTTFFKRINDITSQYEQGLLDIYINKGVYEAYMWCYNGSLSMFYRQTKDSGAVYVLKDYPLAEIENFVPFTFNDGTVEGYVVFKDKSFFENHQTSSPQELSISFATSDLGHSYLWIYKELGKRLDAVLNRKITTEQIANKAVTIGQTTFVMTKSGTQLYDSSSMKAIESWYYWEKASLQGEGNKVSLIKNQYTKSYTAIKIPINGQKKITLSQKDNYANVHSFYTVNEQMVALSFQYGISVKIKDGYAIDIPDGAAYLLANIIDYNDERFMANEGELALPFKPYTEETYVNGINISNLNNGGTTETVDISLPDTIHAVVGDTIQLFFRSVVKDVNPYNYDIVVSCSKGATYPRYWQYKPLSTDVGSVLLNISLKNKEGKVVGSADTTIVTSASPVSPSNKVNVFTFGDSLTTFGQWAGEAKRRLVNTNLVDNIEGNGLSNIVFCGSKNTTINDTSVDYFGVGGWTWNSYLVEGSAQYRVYVTNVNTVSLNSEYTNNGNTYKVIEVNVTSGSGNLLLSGSTNAPTDGGVLTRTSGNGDSTISFTRYEKETTNPLWDATNGKMSFVPYVNRYGGGQIDAVYVLLGWNGLSAWKEYSSSDTSGHIADAKTFARTLHMEYPNAKLKIMGLQLPSLNGGLGANYGSSGGYSDLYGLCYCVLSYNKALKDLCKLDEFKDYCEYVDVATQFDSENNMPETSVNVNTRNTKKEYVGTNGVHPSIAGYNQIADVVYRNIVANYCK